MVSKGILILRIILGNYTQECQRRPISIDLEGRNPVQRPETKTKYVKIGSYVVNSPIIEKTIYVDV